MELYSFLLLILLILISTHFLLRLAQHLLPSKKRLPPGPIGLPIMGDLITIGDRPHESLAKLAKTHGPLMTVKLGFTTTVVACSTEMSKEILQKNDQAFIGRPVPDAVTAENGYDVSMAWLPGGPKWRNLRKLCTSQVFTTQRLDALQSLRHQMVDKMVKRVTDASKQGEELHIGKLVFGTNLNLLSNSMFSDDILDPNLRANAIEELKELIWKIMELAGKPNLADCFPFLKPLDPQGIRRKIKVSYDRLHALLDEIIGRRLKHRENGMPRRDDFLDVLLDHTQEKDNEDFGMLDVKVLLTVACAWQLTAFSLVVSRLCLAVGRFEYGG
ncbi:Cytochrome P450 [Dillenia turbinata]|uniref:Cytochrome P450 n=1 Tax=Dillenia turbinata TaxID=194707 RepID=A0AAN8WGR6_9MAGN